MLKLLRWGNVLLVAVTLLCYLSPFVSPATFWPLAFFGLLYPWLLLLHLIFMATWIGMRRYQFLLSLACLLVGWTYFTGFVGLNVPRKAGEGDALRVKSFNAYSFRLDDGSRKQHEAKALPELFPSDGLDIVCFQEYPSGKKRDAFTTYFQEQYGLKYVHTNPKSALAIFSRFPIASGQSHYFVKRFNGYQYADIKTGQQTIRVFNLHLQSNAVSGMASEVATEGNFNNRETWLNIRGMAARFKRSASKRAKQAEEVAQAIAGSPYPVIVCGDLNAVPQSYTYQRLSNGLQDAFQEAGTGLGTTYGGLIPALRIDYILADHRLDILDFNVQKEGVSDHYSVEAIVQWKD